MVCLGWSVRDTEAQDMKRCKWHQKRSEWHEWFAWRPVSIHYWPAAQDGSHYRVCWYWRQLVQRRKTYSTTPASWEYKELGQ